MARATTRKIQSARSCQLCGENRVFCAKVDLVCAESAEDDKARRGAVRGADHAGIEEESNESRELCESRIIGAEGMRK